MFFTHIGICECKAIKVNNLMSKHLLQLCSSNVCDQLNLRIMLNYIIEMYFGKINPFMQMHVVVTWVMIPYSLVEKYHCFREMYYLHLHCRCEHLQDCTVKPA